MCVCVLICLTSSCFLVRLDEKGREHIISSYDASWRNRGFTSTFGLGTFIGHFSGLPLFTSWRGKKCHFCSLHSTSPIPPPPHNCTKNWTKSSGAMEGDIAVEGTKYFLAKGMRLWGLCGDGDAKVWKALKEELGDDAPEVKKVNKCTQLNELNHLYG